MERQQVLVVVEGPEKGRVYPLQAMICTLGRAADNTVVIDSVRVSRHHAQIRMLPSGPVIEDLGSTNGTWVNDQRLVGSQALMPGDLIRLADTVTLEYMAEEGGDTETVVAPGVPDATNVLVEPDYGSPGGLSSSDVEATTPPAVAYGAGMSSSHTPAPPTPGLVEPRSQAVSIQEPVSQGRPPWFYAVIIGLLVLICLCIALAVYLWFAPATFWQKLFELLGIPMPSGSVVLMYLAGL